MRDENYKKIQQVTITGMVVNIFLVFLKIIGGTLGKSSSLFADGIHSLADLVSDLFILLGVKAASKKPDEDHPYGHGKYETITVYFVSLFILFTAFFLGYDAIEDLRSSKASNPKPYVMIFILISILFKEILFRLTLKVGNETGSNATIANAWHHRSDALSSIAALVGVGGSLLGFTYMDLIATIVVALILAKVGIDLFLQSLKELTDSTMVIEDSTKEHIEKIIKSIPEILDHHLMIPRKLGPDLIVEVHIVVNLYSSISEGHQIAEKLKTQLISEINQITDVLVHVDPESDEQSDIPIYRDRKDYEQVILEAIKTLSIPIETKRVHCHFSKNGVFLEVLICLKDENLNELKGDKKQILKKLNSEIMSKRPEVTRIDWSLTVDV